MQLSSKKFDWLFIILCIGTILGFFVSRALVSISSILLVIVTIIQFGFFTTIKKFWSVPFNRICLMLFAASALSFFWSENTHDWSKDTTTKLSFLALPLGFSVAQLDKKKVGLYVIYAINLMVLGTILNSLFIYASDMFSARTEYMLTTTYYGDHIRFSFTISLIILLNLYLIFEKKEWVDKTKSILLAIVSFIGFTYLHLLSARTGLLCAYIGLGLLVFIKAYRKSIRYALGVVALGVLFPFVAMMLSPRLKDKVVFMIHEIQGVSQAKPEVQYNYTDNNRILSYNVAWDRIQKHPFLGVGTGDLRDEMKQGYKDLYPEIPEKGALSVPHMQLVSTSMALGIPLGIMTILGLILSPLFQAYHNRLYVVVNMLMMFLYFAVDAHLEIQFGILIFLFFTLMWILLEGKHIEDKSK